MFKMLFPVTVFVLFVGFVSAQPYKGSISKSDAFEEVRGNVGIYNGNTTTITKHRYLVGILKKGVFACAGTIVSDSWVLTTAGCSNSSYTAADLTVVGGSIDGISGVHYSVSQIVRHPDYSSFDYDFACLQITTHFYYYRKRKLNLPSAQPADNALMTVAGYGYTDSSYSERSLAEIYMTWLPLSTCETDYKNIKVTWTDRMACADNSDGAALCKGDYGDALVLDGVIYGMFTGSATSGFCTSSAKPAILANVYSVADWVKNITGADYGQTSV